MIGVLTFLTGSKIGRWIGIGLVIFVMVAVALAKIKADAVTKERLQKAEDLLRDVAERIKNENELRSLTPDERRRRLERWMSDNDGGAII